MAIHSSKSFEMPLLLSAFSNVLPQVICGQPTGRECDTHQSVTAVAPGSWAYVRRGQPNEESDYESNCRCQECPSDGKDSRKWYGGGRYDLALACISFEMDQISFRISLQKGPNFVINSVLYLKNSHISHSLKRISQIFTHFEKFL